MTRALTIVAFALVGLAPVVAGTCSSQTAAVLTLPDESVAKTSSTTATATATATGTATATPTTLFSDGFDQGYEANWQTSVSDDGPVTDAKDGSNAIVSLDATQSEFSRLRCNLGGDKFRDENLTASMRVRIDGKPPSDGRTVRLDVRQAASTENIFYAVGAVVSSDDGSITKVGIYKKVQVAAGNYTICQLARTKLDAAIPAATWLSLELAIRDVPTGVHLEAHVNGARVVSYDDDCSNELAATDGQTVRNGGCLAGQTGLGIQVDGGIRASVDDVLVVSL